jgi:hypothetical protein
VTTTQPTDQDLDAQAHEVVAALPPPTEEQLRALAPIWPPRPKAGGDGHDT